MTEHCVSNIGKPNGEPFNIYQTHACRKINIYFANMNYVGCNLDWQNLRRTTLVVINFYWVKFTRGSVIITATITKLRLLG